MSHQATDFSKGQQLLLTSASPMLKALHIVGASKILVKPNQGNPVKTAPAAIGSARFT